jgi:hypothetical protein
MKSVIWAFSLAVALCAGPAFADQNVANTSQKGSLLIWPLINIDPSVDPGGVSDTIIEISNDQNLTVHVECYYVNERKGRVDFDFFLTPKQTVSWDVKTLAGDHVTPPPFPTSGTFPGSIYRGELVCFAVDNPVQHQIAFNHLTGNATVVKLNDADALQKKQAFKYNAWSFIARGSSGLPAADGTFQGTPGVLILNGLGPYTYDACPVYNIANFMPNGATLGYLHTIDNDLSFASCKQDLRQDYQLHLTKLQFTVWNSAEVSFTGAYKCVDSVGTIGLSSDDPPYPVNVGNFDYSTLKFPNARFEVRGVASTQCPGSENTGLLAVHTSSVGVFPDLFGAEDQEIGNTTQGAGGMPGFVLWDPFKKVPFAPTK